jgi:hypothetical protein
LLAAGFLLAFLLYMPKVACVPDISGEQATFDFMLFG